MNKHKSYSFTINNHTYKDLSQLLESSFKYLIFGFEIGKDNTPHIQGYIQYYNQKHFSSVKKDMPRAHIEISKGTSQQNIDYCSKDGEYYEFGERPTLGGRVTYDQIHEAFLDPKNNATIIRQYAKTYDQINQLIIKNKEVKTKYYVIKPEFDAIQEIQDYFLEQKYTELAIITELVQLAAYPDPKIVVYYQTYPDKLTELYPRGVPIYYKYGYEYRQIKPERFIIVTDTPKLYPLYKNI